MKRLVAVAVAALFAFGSVPVLAADDTGSPSSTESTMTKAKKKTKRTAKKTKRKTKRTAHRVAKRTGVDRSDAQRQGKE